MKKLIPILTVLLLFSCNKVSKKDTTGEIHLTNPVTGQGYAGLKFKIIETEEKYDLSGFNSEILGKTTVCEGVTNQAGYAEFKINFKKAPDASRRSFYYTISFDKSGIVTPPGEYYDDIPAFDVLHDGNYRKYDFAYVPKGGFVFHIKNVNCFDDNDEMRFRSKYMIATSNLWTDWTPDHLIYLGCEDLFSPFIFAAEDSIFIQLKVDRNNVEHDFNYAFKNSGYVTDTFKIFY